MMEPPIVRTKLETNRPWESLIPVQCRVPCRYEQRKGGSSQRIRASVCAIRGRTAHTLDTLPGPPTAVQQDKELPVDDGRFEKLNQRIMSAVFELLRVCQLLHCI